MEECPLDFATQASAELSEAVNSIPDEDNKDNLILEHIKKLSVDSLPSVLDPEEKGEWVTGPKSQSLAAYCSGRVALLDFFTYCCINCQHVLPDLRDLEDIYSSQDGFVVVGVHSAKFEAEKVAENVLSAALRLGVAHPILNDPVAELWKRLGVCCWPTLLLLDPKGRPILVLAGEGHRDILFRCVAIAMAHFKSAGSLRMGPEPDLPQNPRSQVSYNSLRFPGKITFNPFGSGKPGEPWLGISDSGNNRIVLVDSAYDVTHIIGGLEPGIKDGNFEEARFDNPQGLCWMDADTLIVCDTGNHVVRKICLQTNQVQMLAGTGSQTEFGDYGGKKYCMQSLASPWDVVLFRVADMDMSFKVTPVKKELSNEQAQDLRRILLIACAGSHQIWAQFMDQTVWWRYKTYEEGSVVAIVGTGREENRNNRYPNSAGLAQPSGLALCGNTLYIADSESSTVRLLDLVSGQVTGLVGGDRNPLNLFAFGDIDGRGNLARLQHPLGVTCNPENKQLFVADTYNHKIKFIDTSNGECTNFYHNTDNAFSLSEPGGLCIIPDTKNLYIADTNNHRILSINVETKTATNVDIKFPKKNKTEIIEDYKKNDLILCPTQLSLNLTNAKLSLFLFCETETGEKDFHLTLQAPQRWSVKFLSANLKEDLTSEWEIVRGVRSGRELPGIFEACLKSPLDDCKRIVRLEFFISLCEGDTCFARRFAVDVELNLSKEGEKKLSYNVNCIINIKRNVSVSMEAFD